MPVANRRVSSKKWLWALVIIPVAILAIIFLSGKQPALEKVPVEMAPFDSFLAAKDGALIVDIRPQQDWDLFHIPNSIHIPYDQLKDRQEELPKDQHIIVVGTLGLTSMASRDILLELGYTRVTNLRGGMKEWSEMGLPIEIAE